MKAQAGTTKMSKGTHARTIRVKALASAVAAATLAGTAATFAGAALAQQLAEPVIEEIVVTGSYIRRQSQFDVPSPLTTVTRDDLDALGANEIGDVLYGPELVWVTLKKR